MFNEIFSSSYLHSYQTSLYCGLFIFEDMKITHSSTNCVVDWGGPSSVQHGLTGSGVLSRRRIRRGLWSAHGYSFKAIAEDETWWINYVFLYKRNWHFLHPVSIKCTVWGIVEARSHNVLTVSSNAGYAYNGEFERSNLEVNGKLHIQFWKW